ncbi:hypothetical protein COLO4_28446 [Corchorus olitorius]|uniref:Uncharacterized protein n=1 Tax=Corchorus olitorius TaxID=93759 RepID=A0A1R3HKN3_9ROSI|nr:hypothetical protein COLO4_28446 [Corchorus olitorius]
MAYGSLDSGVSWFGIVGDDAPLSSMDHLNESLHGLAA